MGKRPGSTSVCLWCGSAYTVGNGRQVYCGKVCKGIQVNVWRRRTPRRTTCVVCSRMLPAGRDAKRVYCSTRCLVANRASSESYQAYLHRRKGKKAEADRAYYLRTRPNVPRPEAPCRVCGALFVQLSGRHVYCSSVCALGQISAWRARQGHVSQRLRDMVIERDKGRCHICGRKVSMKANRKKNPKAATIDHIIPLSLGGTHDLANLALAHRSCNLSKGNRAANDQLRLVG